MANKKKINLKNDNVMNTKSYAIRILVFFTGLLFFFQAWSQGEHKLELIGHPQWKQLNGVSIADTFWLEFNILHQRPTDAEGSLQRVKPVLDPDEVDIVLREYRGNEEIRPPLYMPGSLQMLSQPDSGFVFPESITVSVLIDRSGSLSVAEMEQIREAVRAFVAEVPEGSVYVSSFHNDITSTVLATKDNFDEIDLSRTRWHTDLYNSIWAKLLEFDEYAVWPNAHFEPDYQINRDIAQRKSQYNYLVVLTDGVNDTGLIPKYREPGFEEINRDQLYSIIERYKDKVKVFTLGFGGEQSDFDEEVLKAMSRKSGLHNGYFFAEPDSVLQRFQVNLAQSMSIDYRIKLTNPPKKTYRGHMHDLFVELKDDNTGILATGNTVLQIGSPHNPVTTGEKTDTLTTILWGLFTGFIIILVVIIIIQLIWPLIKNKIFNIRYVKKYIPDAGEVSRTCPLCFDPINEREKVMTRCQHIVHLNCWKANDHSCPEYPQNCTIGYQNYFDLNDPFSKKNKLYYLNWVLYGMFAGFFTWICYMIIKDTALFDGLSGSLVEFLSEKATAFKNSYVQKTSPLLLIGILMGFFLTLAFSYVEEFRRLSLPVAGRILLRGLIGAAIGFITFFIGNMLTILAGFYYTSYWFDWIPWMLFGATIGFSLSVKTTIHWKHGLLGGIFSIIFAFFILYILSGELVYLAVLICFMIYGAGMGISLATVRLTAEHYFVKILNGSKAGNMIAVHKWMSSQGGLNEVYIGKSANCEIQINWEKGIDIGEKHAKIYINKGRNIPVMVSLEKGKSTLYDERIEMMLGKEYDLINGVTFKIGETMFQYVEKEN